MTTLADALALFRKEIEAALASAADASEPFESTHGDENEWVTGPTWTMDRVAITLDVALLEPSDVAAGDSSRLRVLEWRTGSPKAPRAPEPGRHAITIEFAVGRTPGASSLASRIESAAPAPGPGREKAAERLLTELLGPPGFDSSARAAVFCDALRERTLDEVRAAAAALTRLPGEIPDETVRRTRHCLGGIVQSGPLKSAVRAEQILVELLEDWSLAALLELVARHWRTDENW